MPGIPWAAIGAGLGQGAQAWQQQQQDQLQNIFRMLQIRNAMMQQQQQQYALQAAPGIWNYLEQQGHGGGAGIPSGGGGMPMLGAPTAAPAQQPPLAPPQTVRGSWFGNAPGWVDPSATHIQAGGQSVAAGPGIALPNRGTLGQQFTVTAPDGRSITVPQTDIGPAAWTGRGVDVNAPAAQALGYTPQTFPTDAGFQVSPAGQPGAQPEQGAAPPQQPGGPDIFAQIQAQHQQMAQAIDQAMPDAPPEAKLAAFQQLSQMMAPQEKLLSEIMLKSMMTPYQQAELGTRQQQLGLEQQRIGQEGELGQARLGVEQARAGESEKLGQARLDLEKQRLAAGGQRLEASKTLEVLDKDGNVVRTVLARESSGKAGWIDSQTGDPIKLDKGQSVREITPTTAGGGRAGAQVLRQEIAGREVLSDLQNVVKLPVGATTGFLGHYEPGTSLWDAPKNLLVRKLTDQDAQLMQASMASLTRELSILMSPVYGGNYAARQIEPLIPVKGDTLGTSLFKISRIAQSADNAIEAAMKSPILSNDQKEYAKGLRQELRQAVPWTPAQAMAFARQGESTQSFGQFVQQRGVAGGQPQAAGGAPAVGTVQQGYRFKGGDPADPNSWQKVQ